jgi:predicted phosphodiesterase
MRTGNGEYTFNLVNLREEYVFAFIRNGLKQPIVVAISQNITFRWPLTEPTGIHTSLTSTQGQIRVVWTTSAFATKPVVSYGSSGLEYVSEGTTSTYIRDEMCGTRASDYGWRDPGVFHTAYMTGLIPGQTYMYIVGDAKEKVWSAPKTIKMPRNRDTTVIIYGDMGHAPADMSLQVDMQIGSTNTTKILANEVKDIDAVIHIGDISYARGYVHLWDEFLYQVEPVASAVPYMTAIGNHEADYPMSTSYWQVQDSGGECGISYDRRFPMIRPEVQFPDRLWYSFDLGYAHYLIIDTEHNFTTGSPQFQFIEQDLIRANQNRKNVPWIIVLGHRPQYISSPKWALITDDQPVAKLMRLHLDPLYLKYRVDVAFWGHHHSYQKTCKVNQNVCLEDGGTVHVVIGNAGHSLSTFVEDPMPKYFEFVDVEHFGFGRFKVSQNTVAWEYVNDADGKILHEWSLTK